MFDKNGSDFDYVKFLKHFNPVNKQYAHKKQQKTVIQPLFVLKF